jgi:quaternary ammonium compound-resistance protein SugE
VTTAKIVVSHRPRLAGIFDSGRDAPYPVMHDDAQKKGCVMAWVLIVIAGILETGWAIGLKYTDGFTKPIPSLLTAGAIAASLFLLSVAARTLPIGTAYAVWVGIGASGAAILGAWILREPLTPGRIFFLLLLLVSIVGLKVTGAPLKP